MALPVLRRNHQPARETRALPATFDPWRELNEMRERMDQLFAELWQANGAWENGGVAWSPAVDVEEADDAWIVEAELPGVKEKDVTVELRDTELSISGEIEERERRGILRRKTRRVGHFDYRVELPGVSDTEDVEANLEHGVLTIRVPKPEHAKRRRIPVRMS
jgi:HSP20 family protein